MESLSILSAAADVVLRLAGIVSLFFSILIWLRVKTRGESYLFYNPQTKQWEEKGNENGLFQVVARQTWGYFFGGTCTTKVHTVNGRPLVLTWKQGEAFPGHPAVKTEEKTS